MSARTDLGTLEASGLIEIAALQPELEYLFKHALVQEAAYASLLKQDRRSLHRAAAETILALYPDRLRELSGVIGMHFEQAGDAQRAAEYYVTAGEHALALFASKEAYALYLRASSILDDSQVDLRLRAAIGAAKSGWTFPEAKPVEALERAVSTMGAADQRLLADAYFWIAFLRRQRGEVPETSPGLRVALERGAEIGGELNDPAAAALPKALIGSFNAFTGDMHKGAAEMREALDVLQGKVDSLTTAMISVFLSLTYSRLGDFAAANDTIERAEREARETDAISRLDVDIARSNLLLERGEPEKAVSQAADCAERAEGLGAYACLVAASTTLGAANLATKDANGAMVPLERGNELSQITNMTIFKTLILGLLGSARAQLGDVPGGLSDWDHSLASARSMSDRYGEAQTLWGRGRSFSRQSPPDWPAALTDLNRAIELFQEMDAKPSLARSLRDRAEALRATGREADAAADEQRSLELGRELGLKDAIFA
ncbi:MAG TPA: hypothetical protein VI384_03565 [Candidatus Dormibacteraeota bacterium]